MPPAFAAKSTEYGPGDTPFIDCSTNAEVATYAKTAPNRRPADQDVADVAAMAQHFTRRAGEHPKTTPMSLRARHGFRHDAQDGDRHRHPQRRDRPEGHAPVRQLEDHRAEQRPDDRGQAPDGDHVEHADQLDPGREVDDHGPSDDHRPPAASACGGVRRLLVAGSRLLCGVRTMRGCCWADCEPWPLSTWPGSPLPASPMSRRAGPGSAAATPRWIGGCATMRSWSTAFPGSGSPPQGTGRGWWAATC
jgi:hypothetical protein